MTTADSSLPETATDESKSSITSTANATDTSPPPTAVVNQTILFPARTADYVVKRGKNGLGLFAARNFIKGKPIFAESLEFCYADVVDGDDILLVDATGTGTNTEPHVPVRIPSTRDMLMRTHGVDYLGKDPTGESAGIAVAMLEVPGMLMNHSCDPNVVTRDSEDVAARDIKAGEELTDNYILHEDDAGYSFECACGASNCRGKVNLFEELSLSEQQRLLPLASEVVRAEYEHEAGRGPPVKFETPTFPKRVASNAPRLVFPGPSGMRSNAKVAIQRNEGGDYGLYATTDIAVGKRIYEYWRQDWPLIDASGAALAIDMVVSSSFENGMTSDPPEGTVIHFAPLECGAARNRTGILQFSGSDMLSSHCCEPNVVYKYEDEDDGDNWRIAYAARDIEKGEKLTVDYNCMLWDRSKSKSAGDCECGAAACTGTTLGFKHLSRQAQEERKLMKWKRVSSPHNESDESEITLGEALAPHVRVCWRMDPEQGGNAPDSDDSTYSGSTSSSSEDSSED